jgi:c-di-GMP-related signal transduction protein
MSVVDVVVGRQAIFDRDLEVVAYELLFRSTAQADDAQSDLTGSLMTANVLFSSVNIGIDQLVGDKLMFCNASRELLTGKLPILLPPHQTVIEILETVACDDEVVDGCLALLAAGFQLALDDFVWFDGAERFLELATVVKLDVLQIPAGDLPALAARCREFNVELLAEKVETDEQLAICQDLNFDYFQGYGLERPRIVSGKTLSGSELGAARIAASLLEREFDIAELEEILRTEPGLAYQLLQLASVGANHGFRRRVRTLRDALIVVGAVRVQSWLALLMIKQHGSPSAHNVAVALTRAKMCELLARDIAPALGPVAFTAGLLSAFDLLMGVAAEQVTTALSLDAELKEAAFGDSTPLAHIVRDVIEYQAKPASGSRSSGLSDDAFDRVAVESLSWAVKSTRSLDDHAVASGYPGS